MRNGKQLTLWPKMEDMTPDKMRLSPQVRKSGNVQDALQIERDKRYFNKHYNPGDPIETDFNINLDIEEHVMPTDYPETPPPSEDDQG